MPIWLRKSLVVLISILTFGLVSPAQLLAVDHANSNKANKRDIYEAEISKETNEKQLKETIVDKNSLLSQIYKQAEQQSYLKFGTKIRPVILDEFKEVILPNMECAIAQVAAEFPDEDLIYLQVTEMPSGGNTERIFHIKNKKNNQDMIRFHVRKDHPPQQGYWFNFHYHTYYDNFQTHYDLGSIYWDKNTPPKWMS